MSLFYLVGDDTYAEFRRRSYPDCDAIVMCFSMDDPSSLESILYRWLPEVQDYWPNGMTTSQLLLFLMLLLLFNVSGNANLISNFSSNA